LVVVVSPDPIRRKGPPTFTFVDLFAGIGGFHAALSGMGGRCVFAAENDPLAAEVYRRNWGMDAYRDVTHVANEESVTVPVHDLLAAGFPCQPFSKSGAQRGMDETRGTLFWNILRVIEERRPAVLLLENVRNLAGPRHRHEWLVIVETLRDQGYRVSDTPAVLSPHLLPPELGGRPQVRERVFITATRLPDEDEHTAERSYEQTADPAITRHRVRGWDPQTWNLEEDLPLEPDHHADGCDLTVTERLWIDAWDDFVRLMWKARRGRRLPGFPLWADHWVPEHHLRIPPEMPRWKADFLRKNAAFYSAHSEVIDTWATKWGVYTDAFPPSRRKLEWQAQDSVALWDTVMHLRPSGIRAKRPTYLPALVAITQTSIIGPRGRRLSTREAARLQGLPDWFDFGQQRPADTYRQLGNGVNVGVVWHVLRKHVERDAEILKLTAPSLLEAVLNAPVSPDEVLARRV
jgi:DNA (cytosine-5)-methyltransferase 1